MNKITEPAAGVFGAKTSVINLPDPDATYVGLLAANTVDEITPPEGAQIVINGTNQPLWFTYGDDPIDDPAVPAGAPAFDGAVLLMPERWHLSVAATEDTRIKIISDSQAKVVLYFYGI